MPGSFPRRRPLTSGRAKSGLEFAALVVMISETLPVGRKTSNVWILPDLPIYRQQGLVGARVDLETLESLVDKGLLKRHYPLGKYGDAVKRAEYFPEVWELFDAYEVKPVSPRMEIKFPPEVYLLLRVDAGLPEAALPISGAAVSETGSVTFRIDLVAAAQTAANDDEAISGGPSFLSPGRRRPNRNVEPALPQPRPWIQDGALPAPATTPTGEAAATSPSLRLQRSRPWGGRPEMPATRSIENQEDYLRDWYLPNQPQFEGRSRVPQSIASLKKLITKGLLLPDTPLSYKNREFARADSFEALKPHFDAHQRRLEIERGVEGPGQIGKNAIQRGIGVRAVVVGTKSGEAPNQIPRAAWIGLVGGLIAAVPMMALDGAFGLVPKSVLLFPESLRVLGFILVKVVLAVSGCLLVTHVRAVLNALFNGNFWRAEDLLRVSVPVLLGAYLLTPNDSYLFEEFREFFTFAPVLRIVVYGLFVSTLLGFAHDLLYPEDDIQVPVRYSPHMAFKGVAAVGLSTGVLLAGGGTLLPYQSQMNLLGLGGRSTASVLVLEQEGRALGGEEQVYLASFTLYNPSRREQAAWNARIVLWQNDEPFAAGIIRGGSFQRIPVEDIHRDPDDMLRATLDLPDTVKDRPLDEGGFRQFKRQTSVAEYEEDIRVSQFTPTPNVRVNLYADEIAPEKVVYPPLKPGEVGTFDAFFEGIDFTPTRVTVEATLRRE